MPRTGKFPLGISNLPKSIILRFTTDDTRNHCSNFPFGQIANQAYVRVCLSWPCRMLHV